MVWVDTRASTGRVGQSSSRQQRPKADRPVWKPLPCKVVHCCAGGWCEGWEQKSSCQHQPFRCWRSRCDCGCEGQSGSQFSLPASDSISKVCCDRGWTSKSGCILLTLQALLSLCSLPFSFCGRPVIPAKQRRGGEAEAKA